MAMMVTDQQESSDIFNEHVPLPTFEEDCAWTENLFRQLEQEYPGMTSQEILALHPETEDTWKIEPTNARTSQSMPTNRLHQAMPAVILPPVLPNGPLNLNPDKTDINYPKSHNGPNAAHWSNADGEEIQRLFITGTIRPRFFHDIPQDKVITYVNPVCVEKLNDDGTIKFRTRLTIGGDRIKYPYSTAAVTAEMEALTILLNCMVSENANWSTADLIDFYLGTDLPHQEYIRIPRRFIPQNVIEFYDLEAYMTRNAIFCSVHKTH
jgi:hypothetical protein